MYCGTGSLRALAGGAYARVAIAAAHMHACIFQSADKWEVCFMGHTSWDKSTAHYIHVHTSTHTNKHTHTHTHTHTYTRARAQLRNHHTQT